MACSALEGTTTPSKDTVSRPSSMAESTSDATSAGVSTNPAPKDVEVLFREMEQKEEEAKKRDCVRVCVNE